MEPEPAGGVAKTISALPIATVSPNAARNFIRIESVPPSYMKLLCAARGIRTDRFQILSVSCLITLPERQFLVRKRHLQGAQEMHQIPRIVRLNHVRERRHRRSVEAGHEDAIQIAVSIAAHEPVAGRKIKRLDGIALAVGQSRSRWTIGITRRAVALPAFQLLEEFAAVQDAFNRDWRFRRYVERCPGLFFRPARRPGLDERNQVGALLRIQRSPRRHVRGDETSRDGVVEIVIRGQRAGGRRTALERGFGEIARLRVNPPRVHALAIAVGPVAADAEAPIEMFPFLGVPGYSV